MSSYNNWDVPYSTINWFWTMLKQHEGVYSVERERDILFHVTEISGSTYSILLLNEYVMSEASAIRAIDEFQGIMYIINGGNWNKCTSGAADYARKYGIRILNFGSYMGVLNNGSSSSDYRKQNYRSAK